MYIPVHDGSVYNLVRAGREISLFSRVGISPDSSNSIIISVRIMRYYCNEVKMELLVKKQKKYTVCDFWYILPF